MRFSFSRASAPPSPSPVDRLRHEISRLGSEAAVVAAACSSIADAHRKQTELVDAAMAAARDIGESMDGAASQNTIESVSGSLASILDRAKGRGESATRISAMVARLAESADALSTEADASAGAIVNVATTVEQIARSADLLRHHIDDAAAATEQASQSIAGVVASTQQVAAKAENAVAVVTGFGGIEVDREAVAQSLEGLDRIAGALTASSGGVGELGLRVADLHGIIDVVNMLAERTNLLSLNLAIEAAHAGDAGRGLVVIAEELRTVSDRAARATSEVTMLVRGVRTAAQTVSASATDGERLAKEAAAAADRGRAALDSVVDVITRYASRSREANEDLARAITAQAHSARETLMTSQHAVAAATAARAAAVEQKDALSDLAQASDISRRSAASSSRRLKEHASVSAQAAGEVDAIVRTNVDVEATLMLGVEEATTYLQRMVTKTEERRAVVDAIVRKLTELRGLAERTARSANDSSTVSASLQQRVASLS